MAVSKIKLANSEVLANEYDTTSTYAVNDVVSHDGVIYKCNTAITTAEDWTASKWTAVNPVEEDVVVNTLHTCDMWDGMADDYSATSTYKIGDVVKHEDKLYICNTAITTAEAWTEAKWTSTAGSHTLIPSFDDSSLGKDASNVVSVKDEGVTIGKLENDIQQLLAILGNFIEVKETGFYFCDPNLNVGMAIENPECFGLGLANE